MPTSVRALRAKSVRAKSAPAAQRRPVVLSRLKGTSAAQRCSSVASNVSAAASSAASSVSAAATAVASNASATAGIVAGSVSGAVSGPAWLRGHGDRAAAPKASGASRVNTGRRFQNYMRLPALKNSPSTNLPHLSQDHLHHHDHLHHLSLEGTESCKGGSLCLHNPGLERWIFHEAKIRHQARPSYQARQADGTKFKFMSGVILREVFADILHTTRDCCIAYRLIETTSEAAEEKKRVAAEETVLASQKKMVATHKKMAAARCFQKVRSKLLVMSMFRKMLDTTREAEFMWQQCCAGLASVSVSSKAFIGGKSLGVRSFALGGARPCGSISLSLRKYKRADSSTRKVRFQD